jgi:hypothetical protein
MATGINFPLPQATYRILFAFESYINVKKE